MDDGFEMAFFGSHHRKTFTQIKPHLVTKHRNRAGTGAIFFFCSVVTHVTHQIKILFHEIFLPC